MNRSNFWAGLVCLAFAIYVYWLSGSIPTGVALDPLGGAFLPRALAVALGLFGAALAVTGFLGIQVKGGQETIAKPEPAQVAPTEEGMEASPEAIDGDGRGGALTVVAYAVAMGVYVWLLPVTGFLLTSFVMFTLFIYLLGQRSVPRALFASAVITAGLYLLFGVLFDVRLPPGSIF